MSRNSNSDIKVSVLIPVYGVEKYIERCVRSLFGQTMQDGIEFIFVDDCSPDSSIDIILNTLQEYPERIGQVRIIHHKVNKGLAVARRTAVIAARGEYIIHCDSDDWVEIDMYELMYTEAIKTDADVIGCDFYNEEGKGNNEINIQDFALEHNDAVNSILRADGRLDAYLWCRMVKRDFYLRSNLYCPDNISFLEDMVISVPMHIKANKISKVNRALYHYRRCSGMSKKITMPNIESALNALEYLKPFVSTNKDYFPAYSIAVAKFSQRLITSADCYNPSIWRVKAAGVELKYFGSVVHQLSPWLVRHNFDTLNLLFVKFYRRFIRK